MATFATNIIPIFKPIRAVFDAFYNAMIRLIEANPRAIKLNRLNAMSDQELAKRGIKRTEIVEHVFRGSFYL